MLLLPVAQQGLDLLALELLLRSAKVAGNDREPLELGVRSCLRGESPQVVSKIEVTVDFGRCAIPLPELQGLGEGDVLVLDRSATGAVDLLIEGSASPLKGLLESIDGQTLVRLASSKEHRNG